MKTDNAIISDSVTRVTIIGVTLRKMVTRLESQSMTRNSSQSHFYKILEFLIDKPSSCALKEMSIFCFSDAQVWRKFSVLPV